MWILTSSGRVEIQNTVDSAHIVIKGNDNESSEVSMISMDPDSAVELYYDGVKCFDTYPGGMQIHRVLGAGAVGGDTAIIRYNDALSDGPHLLIKNNVISGHITMKSHNAADSSRYLFIGDPDGGGELYHAGIKKFETLISGIYVTGSITLNTGLGDATGEGFSIEATVDTNAFGAGALVMLGADGNWDTSDASIESTCSGMLGIAVDSGTGAGKTLITKGLYRLDAAYDWTAGATLYASEATGELTETAPTTSGAIVRIVGYAISSDVIYFDPDKTYIEV
jgi:hypothetical protein